MTAAAARKRNHGLDITLYEKDANYQDMSLAHRAAHCLDWAAQHYQKQYIPYNVLLKGIQGYSRLPLLNSDEVMTLKRAMSRVRNILGDIYGRELDSQPGIGVRATTDDADALTIALPKKMSRFRSAKNALQQTVNRIDPTQIPDTAEMRPWKQWFNRSVKDVLKTIGTSEFESKLLPPASDDTD